MSKSFRKRSKLHRKKLLWSYNTSAKIDTDDPDDESQQVMNAILRSDPFKSTARSDVAPAVEERNAAEGSGRDAAEEPFQHVGQSWGLFADGGRVVGERDAADWLMDDEAMGRRHE